MKEKHRQGSVYPGFSRAVLSDYRGRYDAKSSGFRYGDMAKNLYINTVANLLICRKEEIISITSRAMRRVAKQSHNNDIPRFTSIDR